MPKVSKIRAPSTRPAEAPAPPRQKMDKFQCTRCGQIYTKQTGNFSASHSPLYRANNGYLPMCHACVDALYYDYKETLGDPYLAMERVCMKLDIYWNPEIFDMVDKHVVNTASRVRQYLRRGNLVKYCNKTYDDTLDERYAEEQKAAEKDAARADVEKFAVKADGDAGGEAAGEPAEPIVTKDDIAFWGYGYPPEFYQMLNSRYEYWTKDLPKPIDNAEEAIYRQICILEATINMNTIAGKPIEMTVARFNDLLGTLNRKPSQQKTEADAEFGDLPLGVGIKIYENISPIPRPLPEFEDVDGIKRYISIWFLGHLCKMLGIKNTYCKLYEEELEKMRLDRPDLEEEDDEGLFNEIFGGDSG